MQGQRQRGYPTPKAEKHGEFQGMHLYNNSIFLDRLATGSPTVPPAKLGAMAGKIKNVGKNHTEVICPFPRGAPRGSQCLPAAAPLQLRSLWKSASPHAAGASGTKGAAAAGALLGQLHGHLSAAPLVWADKLSWRGLFVLIYG